MNGRRDPHDSPNRTEPTLGDLSDLDGPPRTAPPRDDLPQVTVERDPRRAGAPRRPSPRRTPPTRWPWVLLALVLVVGAVLWLNQDRLRGMVPSTELNDTLTRAELALKDGRLDGQDGARALFESARDQEPDNDRARDGLHAVGMAELSQADAALSAGRLDEAAQKLSAARELLGGGSDVDRLDAALAKARGAKVEPDGLIDQAQQALDAGHLEGPSGAGALYRRVLDGDPGNAVAAHGLDKVGAALAAKARAALAAGDSTGANAAIDQLATWLPNYGDLPSLRAAQSQDVKQDDGALTQALRQGQEALRAGRISGPGDDTALKYFQQARQLDPDNAQARAGLGQVAQALIVQANAALDGNDADGARRLLQQAAQLAPRSADLAAAQGRLGSADGTGASAAAGTDDELTAVGGDGTVPTPLSPAQQAQVAQLVQRAAAAARQGQIMLPPGDCAYDLYRSALAIDGNDAAARAGLQALPNQVAAQFNQALAAGNLSKAGEMLTDLGDLSPGDAGQDNLRQRLAAAWADQAEQQLGRGDRASAAQSLDQARRLAPALPRVAELAARLSAGR